MTDPELKRLIDRAEKLKAMNARLLDQGRKLNEQTDKLITESKKPARKRLKRP